MRNFASEMEKLIAILTSVKFWIGLVMAVITAALAFLTTGCNVTRVITTQSSYVQHGDTTTQIVTKTIETYDASKK